MWKWGWQRWSYLWILVLGWGTSRCGRTIHWLFYVVNWTMLPCHRLRLRYVIFFLISGSCWTRYPTAQCGAVLLSRNAALAINRWRRSEAFRISNATYMRINHSYSQNRLIQRHKSPANWRRSLLLVGHMKRSCFQAASKFSTKFSIHSFK